MPLKNDVIDNIARHILGDLYEKATPYTYNNYEIAKETFIDDEDEPIMWIRFDLDKGKAKIVRPSWIEDIEFELADPDVGEHIRAEIRMIAGWPPS